MTNTVAAAAIVTVAATGAGGLQNVSWQSGWSSLHPAAAAYGLSLKAWVAFLPGGSRLMDARVPPLVAFCFFPEDKLGVVCNTNFPLPRGVGIIN